MRVCPSWKDHTEAMRRTCFGGIARLNRLKDSLSSSTKKTIYNALVLPHLDYIAVLYGCNVVRYSSSKWRGSKLCSETDMLQAP